MFKLLANLKNSLQGFKDAWGEHSFRLEVYALPLIIGLLFLNKPATLKALLILSYSLLLAAELFNTAIEKLADRVTRENDEAIRMVKDLASASVFVTLIGNIITIMIYLFF